MHTCLLVKSHWTFKPTILSPAILVWTWWYRCRTTKQWLKCLMPTYSMLKLLTIRPNWICHHLCFQSLGVVAALYTAAKMTRFWARFKQNCAQNPAIREILAKYYRIAPQNRAELAPSLFQNYYYKFPCTWIFQYWFLYVVCLWALLLHWHICWALKY